MPIVSVNLWEEVLNDETEPKVISACTDALVEVFGEQVRPYVRVMIMSVPQRRSGTGGVPDNLQSAAPTSA